MELTELRMRDTEKQRQREDGDRRTYGQRDRKRQRRDSHTGTETKL